MIGTRWTKNFAISEDELEYLVNTMLERETPMTTRELARCWKERCDGAADYRRAAAADAGRTLRLHPRRTRRK